MLVEARTPSPRRIVTLPLLLLLLPCLSACAPVSTLVTAPAPCHVAEANPVRWMVPAQSSRLERARTPCGSIGLPIVRNGRTSSAASSGSLFVISWNVATGRGDVEGLIRELEAEERHEGRPKPDVVLLLQEAMRVIRRDDSPVQASEDVSSIAWRLGMNVAYVPSMPHRSHRARRWLEDRGNAVLSTLPLGDITALELPLARQRRVAVGAAVELDPARLTVLSLHLDTRVPLFAGSVFAGPFARERQAVAVLDALRSAFPRGPLIVGGDFNTVAGIHEPAVRVMERQQFARVACGSPITHRWGWALDHLFASDASIVQNCARLRERFGSDHHPLVARVDVQEAMRVTRRDQNPR